MLKELLKQEALNQENLRQKALKSEVLKPEALKSDDKRNLEYLEKEFGCELQHNLRRIELALIANEEITECDETIFNILKTYLNSMQTYGGNRWWESNNKVVKAYYQLNEPCKLIKLSQLQEGLEMLLNRKVAREEILYNKKALLREAEICYFNYQRNN